MQFFCPYEFNNKNKTSLRPEKYEIIVEYNDSYFPFYPSRN